MDMRVIMGVVGGLLGIQFYFVYIEKQSMQMYIYNVDNCLMPLLTDNYYRGIIIQRIVYVLMYIYSRLFCFVSRCTC